MVSQNTSIRQVENSEAEALWSLVNKLGYAKDVDYFEQCLELQAQGKRHIYIISVNDKGAGYCILNWEPKYSLFRKLGMPEIQDLNVLQDLRKQGIGTSLIQFCENLAREKGYDQMGIGVGLDVSFGAAQKLYIKMGYIPDGNGVTYDRKQLSGGEFKPIDENLCLMMVKSLSEGV